MKILRVACLAFALMTASIAGAAPATSCINCHDSDLFLPEKRAKVTKFRDDVHAQAGLSCHDCHGGNPDLKADEKATAMDPKFASNPYRGAPARKDIPEFCGRCHSSAEYMKRFNPAARVDQVTEYRTSVHGRKLKEGDTNVATCIDCHSVHDIRRKSVPESPVYPTHVAETCSRCHSDSKRMKGYEDRPGHPIPTDQYARWRVSVHATALLTKNDLTAPTCNDCHGNHGATPPGVTSVSFVCGQCHAREAELFRKSSKSEGWSRHNDFLASGSKCADCHDDARASVETHQFSECITCHENHAVITPSVALVGMLPDTPCAFCHEGVGPLAAVVAEPEAKAQHFRERRDKLLKVANGMRLTGDARFDWLVDQAFHLETHRLPRTRADREPDLRPEFARLFDKFRIGKTRYSFRDRSGHEVSVKVRRCNDCHTADDAAGVVAARSFLDSTRGLTTMIARSERILLAAHRGGVEVRNARTELDGAVDNQIELETLAHTFGSGDDVQKKRDEGLVHARAALLAAQASLEELSYRRTGLLVALGVIILVLVALALKIRTLD